MKKKKINKKNVLNIFYQYSRPILLKDIYKSFSPNRKEKRKIQELLDSLEKDGEIISFRNKRAYGLVKKMELIKGTIELYGEGYGFLIPEDKRRKDVYISKDNLKDAWHKDKVIVAILPYQRGKSPEGRVVRILEKTVEEIPVILIKRLSENVFMGRPADTKLPFDFVVDISEITPSEKLKTSSVALVKPAEFYDRNVFFAKATKILGDVNEIKVHEEIVKIFHSIPRKFPDEVLKEAEELPEVIDEKEIKLRSDLRELNFVTIDGEKARDFDDAIYVEEIKNGFKLYVAIADVSHYVKVGSALDKEARDRGNSYYFPLSVEPMFPPRLSNNLCSLNPGVDRLAMVVEMDFSKRGELKNSKFYGAVISSKKRLTYTLVHRAIILRDDDAIKEVGDDICEMLNRAKKLAELLQKKRIQRGSIDFDIPEPEVIFPDIKKEEGQNTLIFDIKARPRYFSHQIIEEFMIAANEAVASFLTDMDLPCMYRVHPAPDEEKLNSLFTILGSTDLANEIPEEIDSGAIQRLLRSVEGKEYEFLVNKLLLRSMMQAYYDPKNIGHFGLASNCYCHFTSPIRRYADLIVHRILKSYLGMEEYKFLKEKRMKKLGEHISNRERVAMNAERDILKRVSVLLLKDKIGEVFSGIISSITDFGFFVELKDVMAEGLVRLSSIIDDYYFYDHIYQRLVGKRTGRMFQIGDRVNVRLMDVNLYKMELDFELAETELEKEEVGI